MALNHPLPLRGLRKSHGAVHDRTLFVHLSKDARSQTAPAMLFAP